MPRNLFPDVPEDLSAENVTDEQIQALLAAHLEVVDSIAASAQAGATPEQFSYIEGVEDVHDQMEAGVEAVLRLQTEAATRAQVADDARSGIAELAARVRPEQLSVETPEDDPEDDPADEPDDPDPVDPVAATEVVVEVEATTEVAPELEPVVAAAPRVRRPLPRPSAAHQPLDASPRGFVASAGISGFRDGQEFRSKKEMGEAFIRARSGMSATPPGFKQDVIVASLDIPYPEDRQLSPIDADPEGFANWDAIQRVTSPEAIVASGGLCAPVTPYYDQQFIATLARPVRDALAGFNANRGGIRYNPPIGIGTISGSTAIGDITAAEDAQGGTFATKSCLTIACVAAVEVDVTIIYHCVTWSNLTSRTFPERVAQVNDTVLAGLARLAETNLLNTIKAGSTNVTQANTNSMGAVSSLLGSILTAAAGYRSRQRMAPDASLRALLPAWTRDLLVADVIRSQFDRFDFTDADLMTLLRSYNINASFFLDGPSTGTGQVFGTQSAGVLLPFPTSVQWALFAEGSWLYLDGGTLELGIVRDSVLNATNQWQNFGELFETAAFVGIESLWITTAVCPSGTTAAAVSNANFCG